MDESDFESSPSPKRRRISESAHTTSRYSSPDELAASFDHEPRYKRRTSSTPRAHTKESRRQAYHDEASEESPDELNGSVHEFYRDSRKRGRGASTSTSSRDQSVMTARSRLSPEREVSYVDYEQKLVLRGHRRGVAAVKFSPDGRCIASCCKFQLAEHGRLGADERCHQRLMLPSEYGIPHLANNFKSWKAIWLASQP